MLLLVLHKKAKQIIQIFHQGWNDLSFHGSNQIPTPNIDALAYHGIILNSHYVQSTCSPSRSALLTGKYPMRIGDKLNIFLCRSPGKRSFRYARRTDFTSRTSFFAAGKTYARIFQGKLLYKNASSRIISPKELGYSTHLIGKWHLGMQTWNDTPTFRGFDHHLGNLNGFVSYYDFLTTWRVSSALNYTTIIQYT